MQEYPLAKVRLVGGFGRHVDSVSVLEPLYLAEGELFTGIVDGEEVHVQQQFTCHIQVLVAQRHAICLRQSYLVPGERRFISLTEDIVRRLVDARYLKSSSLETVEPEGRSVFLVPPESLADQLVHLGMGLLKSAEADLQRAVAYNGLHNPEMRNEYALNADAAAHVALFRCFTSTSEEERRFAAHVSMIASSMLRHDEPRQRMLLARCTKESKMTEAEIQMQVGVLLTRLRKGSGTYLAVKR